MVVGFCFVYLYPGAGYCAPASFVSGVISLELVLVFELLNGMQDSLFGMCFYGCLHVCCADDTAVSTITELQLAELRLAPATASGCL